MHNHLEQHYLTKQTNGTCFGRPGVGSFGSWRRRRGAARACVNDMRFIARMCVGNGRVRNDTFEPFNSCGHLSEMQPLCQYT